MAYLIALLLFFCTAISAEPSDAQMGVRMSPMEWGIDRWGPVYNFFELQTPDPALCQDVCFRDPRCMAWTYEQPVPGGVPRPRCWLKQNVYSPSPKPNCVSGFKIR